MRDGLPGLELVCAKAFQPSMKALEKCHDWIPWWPPS
jgi:hypothetical protein